MAKVQAGLRRRILRAFVGRGLLVGLEAKEMLAKQHSEPPSDKRGATVGDLHLTPLELIDRIAALVPPPWITERPTPQGCGPPAGTPVPQLPTAPRLSALGLTRWRLPIAFHI